jgi:hypothetical protein
MRSPFIDWAGTGHQPLMSNRLRSAEILFIVDARTAVGANETGILEYLCDFRIHFLVLELTGMQVAVLFGVEAVVFGHGVISSRFL